MSNNRKKDYQALACLHARVAAVRNDFTHKITTRLCRENQTVVIEDLFVKGMMACKRRARRLSDISFGTIRRQIEYKAVRYGTRVVVADRWFASSKLCSSCGYHFAALTARERNWTCAACGDHHERDHNAAKNLHRLATGAAYTRSRTALPAASQAATSGTAPGQWPGAGDFGANRPFAKSIGDVIDGD